MHRLQRLTTARPCNSTRQSFSAFRTFTSIVQRQSEHPAPLNSSEQQREHPTPVCRACGVPISASEAGPKSFRETLASMFIVGVSLGWVVAGMMWYYSPTTVHTAGGRRTRDQFQGTVPYLWVLAEVLC